VQSGNGENTEHIAPVGLREARITWLCVSVRHFPSDFPLLSYTGFPSIVGKCMLPKPSAETFQSSFPNFQN
jgi:hypothetical protein